jgi:hypothetical protein
MSSISRGQRQQQAVKQKTSKDKDAIGSSSSVSPSKRKAPLDREQSPAKTSKRKGNKHAEVAGVLASVTSAAETSEPPTLVIMPTEEGNKHAEVAGVLASVTSAAGTSEPPTEEFSTIHLPTADSSTPAQRQATGVKKNKKAEDSDYDGEDYSEDEDEDDEDEDESAKKKVPPTQSAVIAKNKKGRQIKSVTPDGK